MVSFAVINAHTVRVVQWSGSAVTMTDSSGLLIPEGVFSGLKRNATAGNFLPPEVHGTMKFGLKFALLPPTLFLAEERKGCQGKPAVPRVAGGSRP